MKSTENPAQRRGSARRYVALLRGINVGGHHKVPMAELRKVLEQMGFTHIKTLLNSGNVIFDGVGEVQGLEEKIAAQLEKSFGFAIPVLVRKALEIQELVDADPFHGIQVTKDTRLYVTFRQETGELPPLPWNDPGDGLNILSVNGSFVCSVLDLSISKTPEAMGILEKILGKNTTTRNWNTIVKIAGEF